MQLIESWRVFPPKNAVDIAAVNYIKLIFHAAQWGYHIHFVITTINELVFAVLIVEGAQHRHQPDSSVEDGMGRQYLFLFQS